MDAYSFRAKVWLWKSDTAPASWHFVTVPKKQSEEIKELYGTGTGFGTIRVRVTIGKTTWTTSLFANSKIGYILPLKADVRKKENIHDDKTVNVKLEIVI